MLTEYFSKLKLRKQLSKVVSEDAVEAILEGRHLDTPKIQSGRIEFVLVLVRADGPEQLSERIGHVANTGMEHHAVVHSLVGPMVVLAFGTHNAVKHSPTSRSGLVSQMQQRFGSDIKIIHGAAEGHFGLFGSEKFLNYTFTFPQFDTALAILGRLQFGRTEELQP